MHAWGNLPRHLHNGAVDSAEAITLFFKKNEISSSENDSKKEEQV